MITRDIKNCTVCVPFAPCFIQYHQNLLAMKTCISQDMQGTCSFTLSGSAEKLWGAIEPTRFCSYTHSSFFTAPCLLLPLSLFLVSFHPLPVFIDFIFVHPPSQQCDGFSVAMLNFTARSIPQLRALLYGPASPVWFSGDLAPPET